MPRTARRRKFNPDDPRYIRGIHHYCDRWCERCEFSHRCLRFALVGDTTSASGQPKTVFDALGRILDEAQLEIELAGAIDAAPADERSIAQNLALEKRLQRRAQRAGARETSAALTYARMVDEWFNNELRAPLSYVRDLERRVRRGLIRATDAKGELVALNDCIEAIRWHQHFIYVKLCRAFSSRVEEQATRERAPLDSDGSAKIALIAVDRSIAAWAQFQELFPEKTDAVLEILVHLDRLRRGVTAKFPRARKFKRPGFDEKPARKPRKIPRRPA